MNFCGVLLGIIVWEEILNLLLSKCNFKLKTIKCILYLKLTVITITIIFSLMCVINIST